MQRNAMTTVIDPGTSGEAAVFNKSGTAILNIALTNNFTMTIPHVAGRVIVNVSYPVTGPDLLGWTQPIFTAGSDFEIGDEIWVFNLIAPRPSHRIPSTIIDTAGNHITDGSMCSGIIKVANNPEALITDDSALTNWKILSLINP
jgi:hypothetical protein